MTLTEKQYKTLCATCDSVLTDEGATLERMAIPWLHVMREHPVFLRQYEDLFMPKLPLRRLFDYLHRVVVNIALLFRLAWRVVRSSGKLLHGELPKCASVDVVFVSHLLSLPQLAAENDFYFGNVPAELVRQGRSVLLVLINHTSAIGDELEWGLRGSPIPRVMIPSGLPPKEEFRIWRRAEKEASSLRLAARMEVGALRKKILHRASVEATANNTKTSLRICRVIGEVVSRYHVKSLVTTYEGHAWERVVYAAARDARPGIACVGYQHAALFRLQHAAKRSLGKKYNPKLILAAGYVGMGQLQSSSNLPGVSLGILGSNRSIEVVCRDDSAACLVLPEGIFEECGILFAFSLSCARVCPNVRFIWRLHPIMAFEKLVRRMPMLGNIPSNIEISTRTFGEDIARSSWALYRGSTAVVSAAANGVIPIYLEQLGELTIDPLFEISDHHPSVGNVEQFVDALGSANRESEVGDYCRKFYAPLDSGALARLWW